MKTIKSNAVKAWLKNLSFANQYREKNPFRLRVEKTLHNLGNKEVMEVERKELEIWHNKYYVFPLAQRGLLRICQRAMGREVENYPSKRFMSRRLTNGNVIIGRYK